jgi:signal transduction histidine kinase
MIVLAFLVPLALSIRNQAEQRALNGAQQTARSVASGLAVASPLSGGIDRDVAELVLATSGDGATTVFLPDAGTVGAPAERSAAAELAAGGRALTADTGDGVEVLVPVIGSEEAVVVRQAVPAAALREGVLPATLVLTGLGIVLVGAAVVVADRMGRGLVRPVTELAAAARRMEAGDLDARVRPDGPAELADVGTAFNQMADRIGILIVEERESLADLSHRLRTPLTALRLQAEMLSDASAAEPMIEDIDRLASQVDDLIAEARRRSPAAGPRRSDAAAVIGDRLAFWSVLADEQGRRHTAEIPADPIWVSLTQEEVEVLIDTLLENVFSHTPPGTAYRVEMSPSPEGLRVVVEDGGGGFPSADVVARGASGAGSSGLGLDIVRRTAERSGGSMTLGEVPGGGARVEVVLGPA